MSLLPRLSRPRTNSIHAQRTDAETGQGSAVSSAKEITVKNGVGKT